jgi:hypothetical protein
VVHVGFDLMPGDEVLFFAFELPVVLTREELGDFASWLASGDTGMTVH